MMYVSLKTNRSPSRVLTALLLAFFISSCGLSDEDESNLTPQSQAATTEHRIIFGDRSSENIPHTAWEAVQGSGAKRGHEWQQVTTARSSASFYAVDFTQHVGSGVAVSAGQYLTAHHVVDGLSDRKPLSNFKLKIPRGWRFDHLFRLYQELAV
jgi:hypothetical protein